MPPVELESPSSTPAAMEPSEPQPSWLSKDFLRGLKALPEVRKLLWKVGKEPPETNNRREKVAACILATRGNVPAKPCTRCATGKGPMANCVALGGWLHGSCANCHFHGQGYQCSFRDGQDKQNDSQPSPNPALKRKIHPDTKGRGLDQNDSVDQTPQYTSRKRQKRMDTTLRRDSAIGQSLATLESRGPSSDEEPQLAELKRTKYTRSGEEIAMQDPNSYRPSVFRARRGKSSSGMRSSLGRHDSINGQQLPRDREGNGSSIPLNGGSAFSNTARSEAVAELNLARHSDQVPQTSTPYHNGALGTEMRSVAASSAKPPAMPIIDTLSKSQQRQIYGILSGIEGGMSQLQKQFKALQSLLGVDTDVE